MPTRTVLRAPMRHGTGLPQARVAGRRATWLAPLVAGVLAGGAVAGCAATPGSASAGGAAAAVPAAAPSVNIVAVGDIASASGLDDKVAALAASMRPDRVLLLGDTAYDAGTPAQYRSYFDPDWDRFANRWIPIPGNHEYKTPNAAGYRAKFGLGDAPLYTQTRVGRWRIIGLDSEKSDSAKQLKWLAKQLAKSPGRPVLVMWHRARFSSGEHGDQVDTDKLWRLVAADRDVKLVLWGHDHDYERFSLPTKRGRVTAMVVGTGGGELRPTPRLRPRPERKFYVDQLTGVLQLQLRAKSFAWAFVDTSGRTLDSGSKRL